MSELLRRAAPAASADPPEAKEGRAARGARHLRAESAMSEASTRRPVEASMRRRRLVGFGRPHTARGAGPCCYCFAHQLPSAWKKKPTLEGTDALLPVATTLCVAVRVSGKCLWHGEARVDLLR